MSKWQIKIPQHLIPETTIHGIPRRSTLLQASGSCRLISSCRPSWAAAGDHQESKEKPWQASHFLFFFDVCIAVSNTTHGNSNN